MTSFSTHFFTVARFRKHRVENDADSDRFLAFLQSRLTKPLESDGHRVESERCGQFAQKREEPWGKISDFESNRLKIHWLQFASNILFRRVISSPTL